MFAERLQQLAESIGDVRVLALIAKDGIPVETASGLAGLDLEVLAAELIAQVQAVGANHQDLSPGPVRQLVVTTDELSLLVSQVTPDYYLLAVLGKGANTGRARFELRRAALRFEADLL